jgi:carbon-monoxide dehydrogenase small subunit
VPPCRAGATRDILGCTRQAKRENAGAVGTDHLPISVEVLLSAPMSVSLTVNGARYERTVEPRLLLSDFLRHEVGLTGTHVGCEHGVCGACTVLLDGDAVRSCLLFAVQADGREVATVEGLVTAPDELNPLQSAFRESHGLQCGFCTPGILMSMTAFLRDHPDPDEQQIREALSGHLCRCTGYKHIVDAVQLAASRMAPAGTTPP